MLEALEPTHTEIKDNQIHAAELIRRFSKFDVDTGLEIDFEKLFWRDSKRRVLGIYLSNQITTLGWEHDALGALGHGVNSALMVGAIDPETSKNFLLSLSADGSTGNITNPPNPQRHRRVVLITDLSHDGSTLLQATEFLREYGYQVPNVASIVDNSGGEAEQLLEEIDVNYHSFFTVQQIMPTDLGEAQ